MYASLLFLLLSAAVIGLPYTTHAVESPFSKTHGDGSVIPTTITSNKMTVRNQENQAIFEGTVVLTRGPLVVNSDRMIVFFQGQKNEGEKVRGAPQSKSPAPISSKSSRSLDKVEAIGHVRIKQESGHATCQKAVYFSGEEKIIMTGDPVAWDKGTRVSGKQITIYLTEERSVVEGNSHVRIESEDQAAP